MMRVRTCVGIVALGASLLTAWPGRARAVPVADVPAVASASPDSDRSNRPWLAQPQSKSVATSESPGVPWMSLVLLAGVVAMGILAWRHRNRFRTFGDRKPNTRLSVVASVRVGPHAQVVMTQVGDRTLLLGVTDNSVRRIAWIDQPVVAQPIAAPDNARSESHPPEARSQGNFLDALRGARVQAAARARLDARAEARAQNEGRRSNNDRDSGDARTADSPDREVRSQSDARALGPRPRADVDLRDDARGNVERVPLESGPPPPAEATAPPSAAPAHPAANAALELAGSSSDTVEWSRAATRPKRRSTNAKAAKPVALANAVKTEPTAVEVGVVRNPDGLAKTTPFGDDDQRPASADAGAAKAFDDAPKQPALEPLPKPIAFDPISKGITVLDGSDQEALEGQAAGVLQRKNRRRA